MQKSRCNRSAKELRPLQEGAKIWAKNPETSKWEFGATMIAHVRRNPFNIRLDDGKLIYRKRRPIRLRSVDHLSDHQASIDQSCEKESTHRRSKRIEEKK